MFTFQCKHKFSAGTGKSVFYLMSMTNHILRFWSSALLESLELEGTKFPKLTECASSKLKRFSIWKIYLTVFKTNYKEIFLS